MIYMIKLASKCLGSTVIPAAGNRKTSKCRMPASAGMTIVEG